MVEFVFRDDRTVAPIFVVNGERPLGAHHNFPWSLMKLRHSLSGIEAFRCQTFVFRVTWIVCRRFALLEAKQIAKCIVAALTDAGVKVVPPERNNRGAVQGCSGYPAAWPAFAYKN
jgi:hypothetical protein